MHKNCIATQQSSQSVCINLNSFTHHILLCHRHRSADHPIHHRSVQSKSDLVVDALLGAIISHSWMFSFCQLIRRLFWDTSNISAPPDRFNEKSKGVRHVIPFWVAAKGALLSFLSLDKYEQKPQKLKLEIATSERLCRPQLLMQVAVGHYIGTYDLCDAWPGWMGQYFNSIT